MAGNRHQIKKRACTANNLLSGYLQITGSNRHLLFLIEVNMLLLLFVYRGSQFTHVQLVPL